MSCGVVATTWVYNSTFLLFLTITSFKPIIFCLSLYQESIWRVWISRSNYVFHAFYRQRKEISEKPRSHCLVAACLKLKFLQAMVVSLAYNYSSQDSVSATTEVEDAVAICLKWFYHAIEIIKWNFRQFQWVSVLSTEGSFFLSLVKGLSSKN